MNYFGDKKPKRRIPDNLWLTPRCQRIVNDFNAEKLTFDAALIELQSVGNTEEQAKAIIELHRGRAPVKVKPPKKAGSTSTCQRINETTHHTRIALGT